MIILSVMTVDKSQSRCSVSGVLNFHRGHILKFALVAKPFYDIMEPSATFRWGTEQERAFDELTQKLMDHSPCISKFRGTIYSVMTYFNFFIIKWV